ncbi:hypothetical protein HAX54_023736, partial [Datura stramonium]|nr:hypothetical protein [Datura stramonium]
MVIEIIISSDLLEKKMRRRGRSEGFVGEREGFCYCRRVFGGGRRRKKSSGLLGLAVHRMRVEEGKGKRKVSPALMVREESGLARDDLAARKKKNGEEGWRRRRLWRGWRVTGDGGFSASN